MSAQICVGDSLHSTELQTPIVVTQDVLAQLNADVSVLGLSNRAYNILESAGIGTVGDLATRTARQMLKLRNCGRTCVREMQRSLAERGLSLGMVLHKGTPDATPKHPTIHECLALCNTWKVLYEHAIEQRDAAIAALAKAENKGGAA